MVYTREDLRNAVLAELGVIDAQGAPLPEDAQTGDERCQQQLEALYDAGLIPFDLDSDDIPARFFVPLTRVIADTLAVPYGIGSRANAIKLNASAGMKELHRLNQPRYMGEPQKAVYY